MISDIQIFNDDQQASILLANAENNCFQKASIPFFAELEERDQDIVLPRNCILTGRQIMRHPVRTTYCRHIEAMDFRNYLTHKPKKCPLPHCGAIITATNLYIDYEIDNLLQIVG